MVSSGSVCFVLRGIEEYVIDETGYCRIATSVQFQIEKQQKISRRRSHSSDYPELGAAGVSRSYNIIWFYK